jgi:hypothetical protein
VTACLGNGDLAMTELLKRVRVRVVPEEEIEAFGAPRRLLANLNTPADLDAIEALCRHEL